MSGEELRAALLALADEMDDSDVMTGPGLGEYADRVRALAAPSTPEPSDYMQRVSDALDEAWKAAAPPPPVELITDEDGTIIAAAANTMAGVEALLDAQYGRAAPSTPEPSALDAAYRERGAIAAALIRTNGWPAWVAPAPDADGWVIAYAETPAGQVSWHYGPADFDLIDFLEPTPIRPWDGHTTEEKYERLASLTGPGYGAAPSTPEPSGKRRGFPNHEDTCHCHEAVQLFGAAPSTEPALDTCGVLARCGRPKDHRGHHGGWRT